jgi:hypothetical protein
VKRSQFWPDLAAVAIIAGPGACDGDVTVLPRAATDGEAVSHTRAIYFYQVEKNSGRWRSIPHARLAVICGGLLLLARRKLSHHHPRSNGASRCQAKGAVARGYWPQREMAQMGRWASDDDGNGCDDDEPDEISLLCCCCPRVGR